MNEILLINMIGEIEPSLLQDDYMEKDMKRGFLSFLFRLFKKTASEIEYNPLNLNIFEEIRSVEEYDNQPEVTKTQEIREKISDIQPIENKMDVSTETVESTPENNGLSISIFKKNVKTVIKIISGIAAAFILIIGIIVILIMRHKSGTKLYEKKIQIIY
ncbi:MAG: hypothetical protein K0R92_894 [Lachnospiraceae bacterium]|jgi:ATP-dependent Zn protease|nr:hypothetical protein [Lachnospiraceae bacterium]